MEQWQTVTYLAKVLSRCTGLGVKLVAAYSLVIQANIVVSSVDPGNQRQSFSNQCTSGIQAATSVRNSTVQHSSL